MSIHLWYSPPQNSNYLQLLPRSNESDSLHRIPWMSGVSWGRGPKLRWLRPVRAGNRVGLPAVAASLSLFQVTCQHGRLIRSSPHSSRPTLIQPNRVYVLIPDLLAVTAQSFDWLRPITPSPDWPPNDNAATWLAANDNAVSSDWLRRITPYDWVAEVDKAAIWLAALLEKPVAITVNFNSTLRCNLFFYQFQDRYFIDFHS